MCHPAMFNDLFNTIVHNYSTRNQTMGIVLPEAILGIRTFKYRNGCETLFPKFLFSLTFCA